MSRFGTWFLRFFDKKFSQIAALTASSAITIKCKKKKRMANKDLTARHNPRDQTEISGWFPVL